MQEKSSYANVMKRMSIERILSPIQTVHHSNVSSSSHGHIVDDVDAPDDASSSSANCYRRSHKRRRECLSNEPSSLAARRQFARSISLPSIRKGHIKCKLCHKEVWGPNGRYHIERCSVVSHARELAKKHGAKLVSVAGIPIHPDAFKKGKRPNPKPAKIPGFVMSHTVSLSDPEMALTQEELERGVPHGRKGYVRCRKCNSEVFAPNARYHASICHN